MCCREARDPVSAHTHTHTYTHARTGLCPLSVPCIAFLTTVYLCTASRCTNGHTHTHVHSTLVHSIGVCCADDRVHTHTCTHTHTSSFTSLEMLSGSVVSWLPARPNRRRLVSAPMFSGRWVRQLPARESSWDGDTHTHPHPHTPTHTHTHTQTQTCAYTLARPHTSS